jgi:hypothetical protein
MDPSLIVLIKTFVMKENIYPRMQMRVASLAATTFAAMLSLTISSPLVAQTSSPYTIRNVRSGNTGSTSSNGANITTVKTLSTSSSLNVPAVDNRGNNAGTPSTANVTPETNNNYNDPRNNSFVVNGIPVANAAVNPGNLLLSKTSAKLASFTGASTNGQYQLSWETVIEDNVKQYELEYSLNNRDYVQAGVVVASNKHSYSYNHVTDANPSRYYRLKVVDNNGAFAYTNGILIRSSLAGPADLVTPTIIRDGVLNVTLSNTYKNIQVFNSSGIEVFREYLGGRTGNRLGFSLPTLPAGPYFVKLVGNGIALTQRVVIM